MKKYLFLCLCMLMGIPVIGQELKCKVTVNSEQVQGTSKETFQNLQQLIEEFVNNTRWTGLTFQESERIECSMMVVVSSTADNMYVCEYTCQSRRPVYGTGYTTPLMNIKDNAFCFQYQQGDRLEWNENVLTGNLSSMLAYYCYLIIGHDMDSYSRLGGTPYFQQCENIVSAAQGAGLDTKELTGWKAFDSNRNRYALINNLMDEAFKKYRSYYYEYHRLGLDVMADNVVNGRARIAEGLPILKQANSARPATYLINTFLDAKNDELVNIFKGGTDKEKQQAMEILIAIDPTRQTQYEKIAE